MRNRRSLFCVFITAFSLAHSALAQSLALQTQPESKLSSASLLAPESAPTTTQHRAIHAKDFSALLQNLAQNPPLTERVLEYLLVQGSLENIQTILTLYQSFPNPDPLLIKRAQGQIAAKSGDQARAMAIYREILRDYPDFTPTRVQLALGLLQAYRHNEAKREFTRILQDPGLPPDIRTIVEHAELTVQQRDRWKFGIAANYLRERNINNASSDPRIENSGFVKNASMLPQKAHGVDYSLSAEKETNLYHAHYLHFSAYLNGKSYWDNHDYDELSARTYLGYQHKWTQSRFSLLPFYERAWYANHRYKKSVGARTAFNHWFNAHWQVALAAEYGQLRYDNNADLNGHNKFISGSLHYFPNAKRNFFIGGDFLRENTRLRHHSYDLKTVRVGWTEQWAKQIHTRLSYAFSERHYKDNLMLGRSFRFARPRIDRIYQLNATLWKQDWQLPFGLVPKLQYSWKKQRSTFPTLYNYRDHSLNLLLERHF